MRISQYRLILRLSGAVRAATSCRAAVQCTGRGHQPETPRLTPAPHMRYHMVMARKEVLVQLDDELVARLDEVAARHRVSRSEILRRGALAVLEANDLTQADEALQQAYRRQPQDPILVDTAMRLARETAPEW